MGHYDVHANNVNDISAAFKKLLNHNNNTEKTTGDTMLKPDREKTESFCIRRWKERSQQQQLYQLS